MISQNIFIRKTGHLVRSITYILHSVTYIYLFCRVRSFIFNIINDDNDVISSSFDIY